MKPISVRFQCFGPYMNEQFIDFEALGQNGLFLICGETGSGKTTMLDAMCYALYGTSSGGERGKLVSMRCNLAAREDATKIEFIFENQGRRYRFTRSLSYGRRSATIKEEQGCQVWQDGVWEVLVTNPTETNVNRKAEEIIGLTANQFRQVIILPQGKFERLLTSDSTEKEKILVSLFRADRWQRIVDSIKAAVDAQNKALMAREQALGIGLARYDCKQIAELAALADRRAAELSDLASARAQAEAAFSVQQAAHEQATRLADRFASLTTAIARRDAFAARKPAQDAEDALLLRAAQAERLTPVHAEYTRLCAELDAAEKDVRSCTLGQRQTQDALQSAAAAQAEHAAMTPENEERKVRLTRLQSARSAYAALDEATQQGHIARKAQTLAEKNADAARKALEKADARHTACTHAQVNALAAFSAANLQYRAGIRGLLAAELTDGAPCPVCGSTHHPAPAVQSSSAVTDAQLKAAEDAWHAADEALRLAEADHRAAENADRQAQEEIQTAGHQMELAVQAFHAAQTQCIPNIATAEALEAAIGVLTRQITDFDQKTELLRQHLTSAQLAAETWRTRLAQSTEQQAAAQAACAEKADEWQRLLENAGFADETDYAACLLTHEDLQTRQAAAMKYRHDLESAERDVAQQQSALSGFTAPDMAAADARLAEAQRLQTDAQRQHIEADQLLTTMKRDLAQLSSLAAACEKERIVTDENLAFVRHLVGSRDTSLQRYVLSVMLNAITDQANQLLRSIHGGRYRLYRATDGKGLDLEVLDSMSATRRSVATLSGGEKFLVSLSLAIGLSTVVQAQGSAGIRMEALFIDEGFGSLDANSIGDALEVLGTIQRSKGMVGIISHVQRLRETIPSRIEVTKSKNGSSLRVIT